MPPRIVTARSMGLKFRTAQLGRMGPETSFVGHYSAGPRAADVRAGIARAKSFHSQHLGQGWAGIGYHYLIPDDGAIICCRSTLHQGSHVLNTNRGRIGINMPGTTGDRPTKRQARALHWLLHHAHTTAMPRAHRTDRDLSRVPRFGHKDLGATACPGLFHGMYLRGGAPWIERVPDPGQGFAPPMPAPPDEQPFAPDDPGELLDPNLVDDGFAELQPEDEEFLAIIESSPDLAPTTEGTFGPDDAEIEAARDDDTLELLPADREFDEDLSVTLGETEAEHPERDG